MPWPDLPPPHTLLPFEATVRHASMTRAAQELHVTHGAVSRQIRNLERALGVTLFERGTRSLEPTAQARLLAAAVRDGLDRIDSAARQVSRREESGPLALSCEPTLLMRWLIPRLPDLAAQVPGLTVHLSAGGGPVSFEREAFDLALRRDDFPVPARVSRTPLFDEWIGPVCSPDLARRLGGADGLSDVTLLHTSTRPHAWDDWRRLTGTRSEGGPQREQTFEHFYLALQAAVAGLGVAIGPYALVHDDLVRGQLVAPFGLVPDGTGYQLLGPRPPQEDARVSALLDWLRGQAARLRPAQDLTGRAALPTASRPGPREV
ncbi:LysR substrate-binding domain-containing protein [Streptomyces sp. NPDC053755]|uniref:LysR substrate-binding domain-containing protein n=1 Tax=Streptomyces sp. NPDC053755 TaxID=3155815 RepID=UPI0034444554